MMSELPQRCIVGSRDERDDQQAFIASTTALSLPEPDTMRLSMAGAGFHF
jgi:hypothetical protein